MAGFEEVLRGFLEGFFSGDLGGALCFGGALAVLRVSRVSRVLFGFFRSFKGWC